MNCPFKIFWITTSNSDVTVYWHTMEYNKSPRQVRCWDGDNRRLGDLGPCKTCSDPGHYIPTFVILPSRLIQTHEVYIHLKCRHTRCVYEGIWGLFWRFIFEVGLYDIWFNIVITMCPSAIVTLHDKQCQVRQINLSTSCYNFFDAWYKRKAKVLILHN